MSNGSNCPCDVFVFPEVISNTPGLPAIEYRVGDYTSFREALLDALPGEVELANWKPTATGDLALQMVEWWAYLSDILTFYNERIANEDYLRTAVLDQSVQRLVQLLGYRPRPGIGATATLAALVSAKLPFTLPKHFAVQSKPGPGSPPQIFELNADTVLQPLDHVSADPEPSTATLGDDGTVLLEGTITSIKAGDQLVIVERGWTGGDTNYAIGYIVSTKPEKSPRGATNTRVNFGASLGLPAGAAPAGYRLLRSTQTTRLWQYADGVDSVLANNNDNTGTAHLEGVVRQIQPGGMILFDSTAGTGSGVTPGSSAHAYRRGIETEILSGVSLSLGLGGVGLGFGGGIDLGFGSGFGAGFGGYGGLVVAPPLQLSSVTTYTEVLWYANSPDDPPVTPPDPTKIPGIAVLHSQLTFKPVYAGLFDLTTIVIRYGWQDVGQMMPTPSTTFTGTPPELVAVAPPEFPAGSAPVLLEDANGVGESATGLVGADTTTMQLSQLGANPPALAAPINVLYNLLQVSQGKTVPQEVLGSGDASATDQEFVLAKSPLTYLLSPTSTSGQNCASTLQIEVNGIYWQEVPSFYGQAPTATVFVTSQDETQKTHVLFGDGVNGARLPTGVNNVIASYRFGSGGTPPAAGTLTVIATAQPGLTAIHNPVVAGGGADPQPSSQIRQYAPLSVLAFGRAVSGDDYESIAASTPGVSRASAVWGFDPTQQRSMVTVYVGNDQSAVGAAQVALTGDSDPNRPVTVLLAQEIDVQLQLTLEVDALHDPNIAATAAQQSLLDPDAGLFGANRIGIGEAIYKSRIFAACLSVPGTLAVHDLQFSVAAAGGGWTPLCGYRFDPGVGAWYSLASSNLKITPGGQ